MSTVKTSKNAAYTGLFAAVAASSCCIPPVIALIAGVGEVHRLYLGWNLLDPI